MINSPGSKKIIYVRYNIKDFIEEGWHEMERVRFYDWVWSKKEAFFHFPQNHRGLSLYFDSADIENQIAVYDLDRGQIGSYLLNSSIRQIDIFPPTKDVKIVVSKLWKPKNDSRLLGVRLWDIRPLEIYREICMHAPSIFGIEITTLCNMHPPCAMCFRNIPNYVPNMTHISESIVENLNPFLKNAQVVLLHGTGEPLLCPTLFDVLDSVDSKNTYTMFNSNGLLLTEEKCEGLISKGLGEINFSIDAATAKTYGKIRSSRNFTKLKNNIKRLAMMKKEKNINHPRIVIYMILMKENIRELSDFVVLAHEVGAQAVYTKLLRPLVKDFITKRGEFTFKYKKQMLDTCSTEFRDNVLAAAKRAAELGIEFIGAESAIQDVLRSDSTKTPDAHSIIQPLCKKPWSEAYICIDGDVKFCCHMEPKNGEQNMILGNLNSQSFEDIWNGFLARRIRRQLSNGVMPAECWACPFHK